MSGKIISVRTVVAVGVGAALMFVLMRFAAIPTGIPNTNLQLAPAIVAIFAAIFGPAAGFLIGFIGHALTDLTLGYGIWWTWVIADGLFGLLTGLFVKLYRIEEGGFNIKSALLFNAVQILSNFILWAALAPTLDIIIYKEPANKVYLQGLVIASMNSIVVCVLGTILAAGYSRRGIKKGTLKSEE